MSHRICAPTRFAAVLLATLLLSTVLIGTVAPAGAAVRSSTGARADATMACYGYPTYHIGLSTTLSGSGRFEWARIYTVSNTGVTRDARSNGRVIGWVRPENIWNLGIDPLLGATSVRIDFYDQINGRWYYFTEWADTARGSYWCTR